MGVFKLLQSPSLSTKTAVSIRRFPSFHRPCTTLAFAQACQKVKSFREAALLHHCTLAWGLDINGLLRCLIIQMYDKCSAVQDAEAWFSISHRQDVRSWNAIIRTCMHHRQSAKAFHLFDQMHEEAIPPDRDTLVRILSICGTERDLARGKWCHTLCILKGLDCDVVLTTTIMSMYSNCSCIVEAHLVFQKLPVRDAVSWNAMVAAYARYGDGEQCLRLYAAMLQEGVLPDKATFGGMICALIKESDLLRGQQMHSLIVFIGCSSNFILATALVKMYTKCGYIDHARKVFDQMSARDMISWNAMISGYAQLGFASDAFHLLHEMLQQELSPDKITIISIFDACASGEYLLEGMLAHAYLIETVSELDAIIGTALVDMYSKCGSFKDALMIFDSLPEQNVITWNVMISAYVDRHCERHALEFLNSMQSRGVNPDQTTYITILNACSNLLNLVEGEKMHANIVLQGLDSLNSILASLIQMYGNCNSVSAAFSTFKRAPTKNIDVCNAILTVYTHKGLFTRAYNTYEEVIEMGVLPNNVTFIDLLSACATEGNLKKGKYFHSSIIMFALDRDVLVFNSLLTMYGKCSSLEDACSLFKKMSDNDLESCSSMIAIYARHGQGKLAFELFEQMNQEGDIPDTVTLTGILDAAAESALVDVQSTHTHIINRGLETDLILSNALVHAYGRSGVLQDARWVFDTMPKWDVVTWNTLIFAHARNGDLEGALDIFSRMNWENFFPDAVTFSGMLTACATKAAIIEGRWIHDCIIHSSFEFNVNVASALVDMYGKFDCLEDAHKVFSLMAEHNALSWNALIMLYGKQGYNLEAVQLFHQAQVEGVPFDKVCFICNLSACEGSLFLDYGKQLHASIINQGLELDASVATALVSMYAKCSCSKLAFEVFSRSQEKDVVSWNTVIALSAQGNYNGVGSNVLDQMLEEGVLPNSTTFASSLHVCTKFLALDIGKQIHARIFVNTSLLDVFLEDSLINMYARCGSIADAYRAFDEMLERSVITWNSMIAAYIQARCYKEVVQIYYQMVMEGLIPDQITYISLLNACASRHDIVEGKQVHSRIVCSKFREQTALNNALMTMYVNCGFILEAHGIFTELPRRDVVSWNAMISAYSQRGYSREALELYYQMLREASPDNITFASILSACATARSLGNGMQIHNLVTCRALEQDVLVANSLISMYGKSGQLGHAQKIFSNTLEKNVASWNAMFIAQTRNGIEGSDLFAQMQRKRIIPDKITFLAMLDSCVSLGVSAGRLLHMYIIHEELELNVTIATALVDMYSKHGILEDASNVFTRMSRKNSIAWTTMLAAYMYHGYGNESFHILVQMMQQNCKVDGVTSVSILSACSHAGLLEQGQHYLLNMYRVLDVKPNVEHFDCILDLMGRVGQIQEAEKLIQDMPFQPTAVSWMCLLGASSNVGDVQGVSSAVKHIVELDSEETVTSATLWGTSVAGEEG